jgi:hypothetical protein
VSDRAQLAARLTALGFQPAPDQEPGTFSFGEVCLSHPDGIYFNLHAENDDVQLVIVGDARPPDEIAAAVAGYKVKIVDLLPAVFPEEEQRTRERGFVSVHIEPERS